MLHHDPNHKPVSLPRPLPSPAEPLGMHGSLALPGMFPLPAADPGASAPGLNAAPTMSALLQALRRRWLLATLVSVLGAAMAVAVVFLFVTPPYTASARLLIAARTDGGILVRNEDQGDFNLYKANQAAMITSPVVLGAALNKDEVKNLPLVREKLNPVAWLEKALKVDFLLGPEIMRVSLSGDEADDLAPLLNAVVDAYVLEMAMKDQAKRAALVQALKKNQKDEEEKLAGRQRELRDLEHRLGLEEAGVMQAKLQAALLEAAQMRKELRDLQTRINDARVVSSLEVDTRLKQDAAVLEVLKRRAETQKSITEIQRTAQPRLQDELLQGPNREMQAINQSYVKLLRELRPKVEKELREEGDNRVVQLQRQERALAAELGRLEEHVQQVRRATLEVDQARRAILQTETALNELGKQIAAISLEPALGRRITKFQDAETPRMRDTARQLKFAGVAGLGTFGLLLLGVAFLEHRSRRINAVAEVAQGLGLPVVGTLPALPLRARQPLPSGANSKDLFWQSVLNESMDAIRTLLLHAARTESLQVVMVTSAAGGEGKTSVASHLAASLARAWRKTLLIDGDLRNPAAHKLFDMLLEPGLSEVLRGEINLADAIRPTPLSRLSLMPAGAWDGDAVQALAQDGVKAQFAQLKQQYDFIVVDSCPVLPVADSLLLGQHVDAVVFTIMRDVSRMPSIHAAQQRLSALGIRTLGAVVIGASDGPASLSYQYPVATTS
jgi:capsular exopolysaccharide synthesis family protein